MSGPMLAAWLVGALAIGLLVGVVVEGRYHERDR